MRRVDQTGLLQRSGNQAVGNASIVDPVAAAKNGASSAGRIARHADARSETALVEWQRSRFRNGRIGRHGAGRLLVPADTGVDRQPRVRFPLVLRERGVIDGVVGEAVRAEVCRKPV